MAAVTDPWVAEAIDLRKQGLSERAIAEAVGKAASTVHAALATAKAAGLLDEAPARGESPPSSNGNGHGPISPEDAERLRAAAEAGATDEELHDGSATFIPGQTDLADFIEEAGEAVGPMPPREPEDSTYYVEQLRIDGTTQFALDLGGRAAESCVVAFSGKAEVDGFLKKGDRLRGTFEMLVVSGGGEDKLDKQTGVVTEAVQRHKAVFTDLRVAS